MVSTTSVLFSYTISLKAFRHEIQQNYISDYTSVNLTLIKQGYDCMEQLVYAYASVTPDSGK